MDNNIRLGKKLSWLLRHGAQKEGIAIKSDGFVRVMDITHHPRYRMFTMQVLEHIVADDSKQRYTLRRNPQTQEYEIRANQGHSLAIVEAESCLEQINNPNDVPKAVHGTYLRNWERIKTEGLKCMQRNQVHFSTTDVPPNSVSTKAISGFRSDCQVLIYLNVAKAMADNLKLYRSANNVILCSGIDGCIPPKYFLRVVDRRNTNLN